MITARLGRSFLMASISISIYSLFHSQACIFETRYRVREIDNINTTTTTG